MSGYYVIWNEDCEEYRTKREAIKRAKCLFDEDSEVFIQKFNDNWDNGYLNQSKAIYIKDLM